MGRKDSNFRGSAGGNYRRFCGTGQLRNYNRGAGRQDGHDNSQRLGSLGDGGNFNRSFDNSGNGNNNNFGNANSAPPRNKDYDRFQKFRDAQGYGSRNNINSQRDGRRRDYNRRSGNQNQGGGTWKDGTNWYESQRGAKAVQAEEQQPPLQQQQVQNLDYPPVVNSPGPATISPAEQLQVSNGFTQTPELKKNIKKEKIDGEATKPIIKPSPSSSSSSSDSNCSDNDAPTKSTQAELKTKVIKIENAAEKSLKKVTKPPSSSSSSSLSEEEGGSDHKESKAAPEKPVAKVKKINNKSEKKKQLSEEDLICLGKLEKKFVIEDDASEEVDVSQQNTSECGKNRCLICDKQGHTAFECQMICKNCSAPYHNMKSCPKPANLSIVMQSFMEFCMVQMNQFNPEHKFTLPPYIGTNQIKLTKESSVTANKKGKKSRLRSKPSTKRVSKRKRRRTAQSSDDEDDDDEAEKDVTEEEASSQSESGSDSSEEVVAPKLKKKRTQSFTADPSDFPNTFIPPFSTFPTFGAAAAAYNPLLLSQLIQGRSFGTPQKHNYK